MWLCSWCWRRQHQTREVSTIKQGLCLFGIIRTSNVPLETQPGCVALTWKLPLTSMGFGTLSFWYPPPSCGCSLGAENNWTLICTSHFLFSQFILNIWCKKYNLWNNILFHWILYPTSGGSSEDSSPANIPSGHQALVSQIGCSHTCRDTRETLYQAHYSPKITSRVAEEHIWKTDEDIPPVTIKDLNIER